MQGHAIVEDEDDCINVSYPLCIVSVFGTNSARSQKGYFKMRVCVCVSFDLCLPDAVLKVSCHCQSLRFSTFPWMYLLSGIFKDAEMAYITYMCINLFISVNTILITSILHFLGQISQHNPEVSINCLCMNAAVKSTLLCMTMNSWLKPTLFLYMLWYRVAEEWDGQTNLKYPVMCSVVKMCRVTLALQPRFFPPSFYPPPFSSVLSSCSSSRKSSSSCATPS